MTVDPYDECENCHGDAFASSCSGTDDCADMDCGGSCGGSEYLDPCGMCDDSELNDCYDLVMDLHVGSNLISFPALPQDVSLDAMFGTCAENEIGGIIGQGMAATCGSGDSWIGTLAAISQDDGYWFMANEDVTITEENVSPTSYDTDGEVVYVMESGSNLISYPFQTPQIIEDALATIDNTDIVYAISGEGIAALNTPSGWIGSLDAFEGGSGYWIVALEDFTFSFAGTEEGLARKAQQSIIRPVPELYNFVQSNQQTFYFVESATIDNKPLDPDDIIIAYNNDMVVGARYWAGDYTDVPAMGMDNIVEPNGYCTEDVSVTFKVWDSSTNQLIDMVSDGDATWKNLKISVISLTDIVLPEAFSLDRAYPNPFNPTTTLSFTIPIDSEVSLSVYNMQGREVSTLIDANMEAGYHSVVWNADCHSSGMYFVKMVAGEFVNTQKLMLIK
jgi:hypothetical protein